jgi:hypothetical protein
LIDINIIKQVTEFADWLLSLPMKLVDAVMKPQQSYLENKIRISKLNELTALREISEHLQHLYIWKGNVYVWANNMQAQRKTENVEYAREIFSMASDQLGEIEKILIKTPFSDLHLTTQAALKIAEAKSAYRYFANLPDAEILGDRGLIDIIAALDSMEKSGEFLFRLIDVHQKELEHDRS